MPRWKRDEPNMSDGALLVKVEDLIYMALGPENLNVVDFKILQLILHILARQLRMLEQQVEIEFRESSNIHRELSAKSVIKDTEREKAREKGDKRHRQLKDRSTDRYDHDTKKDKGDLSDVELIDTKMTSDDMSLGRQKAEKKKGKESAKTSQKHQSPKKGKKQLEKEKKTKDDVSFATESSITIQEVEQNKSKVLVVADKGPLSSGRPRVGSVEVVTRSQFELLEGEVRRLAESVGMSTDLTLPDNEQLKSDLLEGNLTLTEAMQAMQVNARVQAAEHVISRMAGLLTQLASTGAIPEDLAQELNETQLEMANVKAGEPVERVRSRASSGQRSTSAQGEGHSPGHRLSSESHHDLSPALVTRSDLDETLRVLKAEMTRNIQQLTSKSALTAEAAAKTAQSVSEKLEVALHLEGRMNEMQSLVSDYAVQLDGFDAGLATQMHGFQEQMGQIRTDLKCGLEQLAAASDDTNATAMRELTEHYEDLVSQLEHVNNTHQAFLNFQANLSDELRSLVESVEMLGDQKADRDEIQDALRDKADISRLSGLLTEEQFKEARTELEQLFEGCHQKFRKQDKAWMCAMEDLMDTTEMKVGQLELASEREALQEQLRELHEHLQRLEEQLGEPKAALLMRHLCRGAVCASCGAPALMKPGEEPIPPALPASLPAHPLHPPQPTSFAAPPPAAFIPPAPTAPHPCTTTIAETTDDNTLNSPYAIKNFDTKKERYEREVLRRWCGGAHTVQAAGRQRASRVATAATPTRRYDGVGTDGKLYLFEEELQPCVECNAPKVCDGAGDASLQERPVSD